MITSMTGFGSSTQSVVLSSKENLTVTVEIKTLNARFFEMFCKLPSSLNALEIEISNQLKSALCRGKVFFSIKINEEVGTLEVPSISISTAQKYLAAAEKLKKECGLSGELTINDLLQFPSLFFFEKKALQSNDLEAMKGVIAQATEALVADRNREGATLLKDLLQRFSACKEKILLIKTDFEVLIVEQKKLIAQATQEVHAGVEGEKAKLDDLYAVLNKIDINEEVARFLSHLEATFAILQNNKNEEKGRRLDFLLQELSREINTITAKCSNYQIASLAVDIKVEIEKAREQVQNIV